MSGISRRYFNTGLLASLGSSTFGLTAAFAQAYPSKDVTFICAFAPGSGGDTLVRFLAEQFKPLLGRNVMVDNKVGAMGSLATEYVARAPADGHTVFFVSGSALAANQSILQNPPVDIVKELQAIGTVERAPYMLAVKADSPYQNLTELTAAMKEKGDKVTYGHASGGAYTVFSSLYKEKAGLSDAVGLIFQSSGEALNALLAGDIDFTFFDSGFTGAQEDQGTVRVLGMSSKEQLAPNRSYPTMAEQGIDIDLVGWWAGFVPAATPRDIVDKLGDALKQVIESAPMQEHLLTGASMPWTTGPDEAQSFLAAQVEDWAGYVELAKIPKV